MATKTLSKESFDFLQDLALRTAGIDVDPRKQALLEARLSKRVRALNLSDNVEYIAYLQKKPSEVRNFITALSTNFTSFFREKSHFSSLAKHIEDLVSNRQRRIRLWCAASSTGQEPYTIAMTMAEIIKNRDIDWRILATDISDRVLKTARRAVYDQQELQGVSAELQKKYFLPVKSAGNQNKFRVSPQLQQRVVVRRLNLATAPFPLSGPLDTIFCRNVMMYLSLDTRRALEKEFLRLLRPGAYLFIGQSEQLTRKFSDLYAVSHSAFRYKSAVSG